MFHVTTLLSLAVAIQAVLGSPIRARTPYTIKETHNVPRKWHRKGRAPVSNTIHLQIGVKQGDFDELERHLYEGKRVWSFNYSSVYALALANRY
jgi:tripeptidyl-peptidase I